MIEIQSNGSIHCKGSEEHKAQLHKSLYLDEIIRPGTRMPRIKRIYTDPGSQRLGKAPEHGEAMIVCPPRLNNHKGHNEKRNYSVLSVYSVVDQLHSDSFFQNKFKNNKPQINADERRLIALRDSGAINTELVRTETNSSHSDYERISEANS